MKAMISVVGIALLFSGCAKPKDGFAPDITSISPVVVTDLSNSSLKYGSQDSTASGWVVDMDQADSVQEQLLANGWQVEIVYE